MRKTEPKIFDHKVHDNIDELRICPKCLTQSTIQEVAGGWYVCDSCRDGFRSFENVANQVVVVRAEYQNNSEIIVVEKRSFELFSFLSLFFLVASCFLTYFAFENIFHPYTSDPSQAKNFGLMLLPIAAWSTLCWLSSARLISMLFTTAFLSGLLALFFISMAFVIIRGIFFSDGFYYYYSVILLVVLSFVVIVYFIVREFYRDRVRSGEDEQEVAEEFGEMMADAFVARNSSWLHHYQLQRKILKKIGAKNR